MHLEPPLEMQCCACLVGLLLDQCKKQSNLSSATQRRRGQASTTQGGFCSMKHRQRNADLKMKPGRLEIRETPKKLPKPSRPQKPTETQGPCPGLKDFCIKALIVVLNIQKSQDFATDRIVRESAQPLTGKQNTCLGATGLPSCPWLHFG